MPVITHANRPPTASTALHLSSFFKAKALPGMEKPFKKAKDTLMVHLITKPEIWKFLDGSIEGPQRYSKAFDAWDLTRFNLLRALVDLSDRNILIDLSSLGPWHFAEFEKGGDWEERIIAHALQTSQRQAGMMSPRPSPPPVVVQSSIPGVYRPDLTIPVTPDEDFGILDASDTESVTDDWDLEAETPLPSPEEDTPAMAKTITKKATPKAPTKATPTPKVAPVKRAPAPKITDAMRALAVKARRDEVIKSLLRRKFIKDALAAGSLTLANLKKTPTPRLEKLLERGTYLK